jgi:hypothetical protein
LVPQVGPLVGMQVAIKAPDVLRQQRLCPKIPVTGGE